MCIRVTGCIETSESSNTAVPAPGDTGREPYMGFSVERGSWGWRDREASCLPKTMQSPVGPRQPSRLGRGCETRSSYGMDGAYTRSCICSPTSLCINIFMYMCSELCLFRHYLLWAQIHRKPRNICVFWSHNTVLRRRLRTHFAGVIL